MRVGQHFGGSEFAHLAADRLHVLVEAGIAGGCGGGMFVDQHHQPRAVRRGVAGGDQAFHRLRPAPGDRRRSESEFREADDLALAHGDAAEDLRQIFAQADGGQQPLRLAKTPLAGEPPGIGHHLADRLDIGRQPGKAMRRVLLALDQRGGKLAVFA